MYGTMFQAMWQWQAAAVAATQMTVSAAAVVQLRMAQMALGQMTPDEAVRMIMEKPVALMMAGERSARALAANRGLPAATAAGVSPLRTAARRNEKRLRKKASRRK